MRIPAPPDALRVARALMKLTQRAAAEEANVTHRYLSTVETSDLLLNVNLEMVDFYTRRGIVLLGDASIGNEFARAGAKWSAPSGPDASAAEKARYHHEAYALSFRAARTLVSKQQTEIALLAGLSLNAVKKLERGERWDDEHSRLRNFYEGVGVEFTGWGDASTGNYYGVGVRWARPELRTVVDRSSADVELVDR